MEATSHSSVDYFPLTCLTHGSLLNSPTHTDSLAQAPLHLPLTDINNMSQCVLYWDAMKKADRKPVLGVQLRVCEHAAVDIWCGTLILLCKNLAAWQEVLKIIHKANSPLRYRGEPSITVDELIQFDLSNFICIACDLGISSTKIIARHASSSSFYLGVNPYQKWTHLDGFKEVPITKNACLTLAQYPELEMLRKKENKNNSIEEPAHVHDLGDLRRLGFTDLHFRRTLDIYEEIEEFKIKREQSLPTPKTSKNIRELCLEGLQQRNLLKGNYVERLNHELAVIHQADMEGYFLVVSSITSFLKGQKRLLGTSRGSVGGSLISYALGITELDPLPHDLMFERFYNADRGGLPDIDIDIPPDSRDSVFQHVQGLYGVDNFAQLCTFGTLKGSAALKLCLSVNGAGFLEQNEITKNLPKESKIAPQLKEQEKEGGTASLLYWALKNTPKKLAKWCTFNSKDGKFDGKYAKEFELAIKLDGVIDSRGRHASAFALSDDPLYNKAPMVYDDKSQEYIVGVEMNSAEALGLIKIDLLGLDLLSQAEYMREVLQNGIICKSKYW